MEDRLKPIDMESATAEQRALIERLGEGRGRVPTPFNVWLHSPRLAAGMEIIGGVINESPVLSEAESEVAILATAVFWNAPYVVSNHHRHALKAGVPGSLVSAILEKRAPEPTEGRLGVIAAAVFDILAGANIDDVRFKLYEAELGRAILAELLIIVGYFTAVSLGMNLHGLLPKQGR
jgi:4-carboxymuconolactone decarboxylase